MIAAAVMAMALMGPGGGVSVTRTADRVRIEIDGELFTEMHYRGVAHPFFYPLNIPGGTCITRRWPMEEGPGEVHDHPHHRSLWFAFGDVNGCDFWSENEGSGMIRTTRIWDLVSGPVFGSVRSAHEWVSAAGKAICSDEQLVRVYAVEGARIFDFEITLAASHGDLVFGDTKEGMMAVRLAPTLRVKGPVAGGKIVTSAGDRDGQAWGRRADWVDYSGPLGGRTWGVAIFDHPANLRHPTWWHVRTYGLFAANPFGLHYFEKAPSGSGSLALKAGEHLTFRYRFYLHRGDEKEARVADLYRAYAVADRASH